MEFETEIARDVEGYALTIPGGVLPAGTRVTVTGWTRTRARGLPGVFASVEIRPVPEGWWSPDPEALRLAVPSYAIPRGELPAWALADVAEGDWTEELIERHQEEARAMLAYPEGTVQ